MASRTLIDTALKIYKSLGGNTSKVLGTRTNVNFLGKGKSPELMVDMDINPDALGVLPKSKAVEELESAMGYLTSGKLNDLQANQLIKNMNTMKSVYDPAPAPANITDMVTGTRNLDQEGLMSLRSKVDDIDLPEGVALEDTILPRGVGVQRVPADEIVDDLPPPGSRGGPDDIAAPFTGAGLESLKKVQNFDRTIGDDLVNKVYDMAGVSKNAQPVARGNARDFLNTIKDLEDPQFPGGPTLSSVMELDDLKFMTEGGGGALGDPLLLVQKYFGPKVASSVSQLDGRDQIELFAKRLVRIKDVKGNTITDRNFDPTTADFDFAEGGRVPFFRGKLVGKALGLAKKAAAKSSGKQMGYGDIRKYGLEAEDISTLFRNVAMDKSLVGKEKTLYMQRLNQVLKNPDDFPDGIREIQQMLGIDPIGFKGGGLAEILEV
jgi:hypothetical protein